MNKHRDYTGKYVILARNLCDAWNAAKLHSLAPGDWVYPRTIEEAEALTGGEVVEAPGFDGRADREEFRSATAHLPRLNPAHVAV